MEHFIDEWKFFSEEMSRAYTGRSVLCGLNDVFCDKVIRQADAIVGAPTREALLNTSLEQLCGQTESGKFFYLAGITQPYDSDYYSLDLALSTDGLPVHYTLTIAKTKFDHYLAILMSFFDPKILKGLFDGTI